MPQLEIPTFQAWVAPGQPCKVYVQRGGSTSWIEAKPYPFASLTDQYEYFIETRINSAAGYNYGSLYIFASGTDFSDRPKVKIEF